MTFAEQAAVREVLDCSRHVLSDKVVSSFPVVDLSKVECKLAVPK